MSGHIINDFKDLRSLIRDVTNANPAETTRQQNEKKMGVYKEDEAQPIDDKKPKDKKYHAGEEEIKRAYLNLGRAAQGSLEYQRKLLQKELAKMGFKTYSQFAFDTIFKFENAQQIKREQEFKDTASQFQLESALSDMQNIVKTKGAKKINGIMVDLFTASIITKAYDKVNDANKTKMEKANLQTLVQLAHRLMGMKEELQLDESKMGDLLIDIQMGATAKELARDHDISIGSAKDFLSQYYGNKKTRKAPGLKKEGLDEYAVLDTGLEKALKKFKVKFSKDLKDVTEGGMKQLFQDLEDGASVQQISKKYGIDMKTAKSFVDDYKKVSQAPRLRAAQNDPLKEAQTYKDLKKRSQDDIKKTGNKNLEKTLKFLDDMEKAGIPAKIIMRNDFSTNRIPAFNIRGTKLSKFTPNDLAKAKKAARVESREEKLKEQKEQAEQSPFKLKSQQYPRAIAVNTDGFGKRHATVEDIIAACDSFGMIIDKELQVEQIQKQLGKKGFISFKQSDLEDVFESRETERMILALESDVEEQGPIEYTKAIVEDAYIMGEEIEFLKPDGLKTAGKVLKLSGNTFNVKDKFTGKSFTYKYINEEKEVKTFTEVINEISLHPDDIRKTFPNVWAQKDDRMNSILMALVNLHGYNDNVKAYKKNPKAFIKSLKDIGKNDASLKRAGLTKRNIGEDVQERFSDVIPSKYKTKEFEIRCSTKDALKIVKFAQTYAQKNRFKFQAIKDEEMGLTGMSSSTEIFVHNIDYDPESTDLGYQAWVVVAGNEKGKRFKEVDLTDVYKRSQQLPSAMMKGRWIEDIQEGRFSAKLIKQAGGIAFDKRYYMGNMSGAIDAIEKLKKGLSDDPKVKEMLRIANESNETTDYTNWLPEGGDKEAYQKFFNAALKKFGVSSPDELEGDKKKKFFDYVDKNWKGDHEEVEQDVHKTYKMDGRRKNFKEKMRKLGYIKGR